MKKLILILLVTVIPYILLSKTYIGSTNTTTLLSSIIDNIENKESLHISGKFVIDVDYSFYGYEIDMDPNSITLVKPNIQSAFYDSHIFCSKGMWTGIANYGSITVSESFIEDATVAVNVLQGGQANIRKTDFRNNVIGAQCTGNGFLSADQCIFTAELNGLHMPYPAIFNTSYRGIYITNCSGYYNVFSNNYFNTVQNGIVIENSTAYSDTNDNNIYENIYPNSEYASTDFGNAIQVVNSTLTQAGGKKYSNRGLSSSLFNFIKCYRGIYSNNSTLNISDDDFDSCTYGIVVTNSSNLNEVTIKSNNINNSSVGILLYENKAPVAVKGKITGNTIKMPQKLPYASGIRFENSFNTSSTLVMSTNNITVQSDNSAGIFLRGVSFISLYKNNISIIGTYSTYSGIDIVNCTGTVVSTNVVKCSSILYKLKQDANKVGIRVRDSEQSDIGCNDISQSPVCLQLVGECDLSKIHGNSFKNAAVGLMIGNGDNLDGVIGNQVGMQNEWSGIFTRYKAWYSVDTGNPFNITNSYFFVDFAVPIYNPTNQYKSEVTGDPWFYNSKDSEKPSCGTFLKKDEKEDKEKDYDTLKTIMDIISRSIISQPVRSSNNQIK